MSDRATAGLFAHVRRPAADETAVDGIAAIENRIATIQARLDALSLDATLPTASTSTSASATGASFDAVLASALGAPTTGGLTPAARLAPGQYGRLEPPAELVRYGNGRIPAEALAPVGVGDHRLWAPAANAMNRMIADARAQGVTIGITDSYRDYASQERLAATKGLYSQGGLAATPGTSNHGWGVATDLDLDNRAQQWMRDNGWRYGFVEDVPREPWHWTYRPAS
jgi:hypothetical protein